MKEGVAMPCSPAELAAAESEPRPIRVLIVDDHEVVREGVCAALSIDGTFQVVAAVATCAAALVAAARTRPDVALVDLRLPDAMGDRLCSELHRRLPSTAVVVLSSYISTDTVLAAMQAGASAYITKAAGLSQLRDVLCEVAAAGEDPVEPQIVRQLRELVASRTGDAGLTPHQERVLELSAEGLTYKEIGARLYISESTVRFHMQKMKAKFGTRTKTELIARAIRTGAMAPAAEELGPTS